MVECIIIQDSELPGDYRKSLEAMLRSKDPKTSAGSVCEWMEQIDRQIPDNESYWKTVGAIALSIENDVLQAIKKEIKRILDESYEHIPERTRILYRVLE